MVNIVRNTDRRAPFIHCLFVDMFDELPALDVNRGMKKLARIAMGVLMAVVLLVVGAGGYGLYVVRSQFPQVSGTVKLAGLKGTVEIVRDRFGVPHIYADYPEDLFRAQGYVHAQDRYFQMEFWRRIGQGRLAELFGAGALDQDKFIRTVGWSRTAAEEAKQLDPEMRALLESYATGVNDYALSHVGQLGVEFKVLGLIGRTWQPEAWKPENTLTWAKAMAWNLGGNLDTELLRAAITAKGGAALSEALLPPYPKEGPVIVPSKMTEDGRPTTAFSSSPHHPISKTHWRCYRRHASWPTRPGCCARVGLAATIGWSAEPRA